MFNLVASEIFSDSQFISLSLINDLILILISIYLFLTLISSLLSSILYIVLYVLLLSFILRTTGSREFQNYFGKILFK